MIEIVLHLLYVYFSIGFLFMLYEDIGILLCKLSNDIKRKKAAIELFNNFTFGVRIMTMVAWPFILRDYFKSKNNIQ